MIFLSEINRARIQRIELQPDYWGPYLCVLKKGDIMPMDESNMIASGLKAGKRGYMIFHSRSKGKTVLSFQISRILMKEMWKVYYLSLKLVSPEERIFRRWLSNLKCLDMQNTLFVLDDVHLRFDELNILREELDTISKGKFLFISRISPSGLNLRDGSPIASIVGSNVLGPNEDRIIDWLIQKTASEKGWGQIAENDRLGLKRISGGEIDNLKALLSSWKGPENSIALSSVYQNIRDTLRQEKWTAYEKLVSIIISALSQHEILLEKAFIYEISKEVGLSIQDVDSVLGQLENRACVEKVPEEDLYAMENSAVAEKHYKALESSPEGDNLAMALKRVLDVRK
jgi:hypothetical protein